MLELLKCNSTSFTTSSSLLVLANNSIFFPNLFQKKNKAGENRFLGTDTEFCGKINDPKMAQFSKFKLLFASKLNLNEDQFYREIAKYDYFNNLKIILKIVEKLSVW